MLATIQSKLNFMHYGGACARGGRRPGAYPARERRSRVRRMASVYFESHTRRVLIRNLSLSGMMMETALPPEPGQLVVVTIEGLPPIWGQIRWRLGGKAGVLFEEPITAEALFLCALREPVANDDLAGEAAMFNS